MDRVDTTATVWLGLTMGCARCHDHKYDPVTQREFYEVFAFFNNVPEKGRAIKIGNSPPSRSRRPRKRRSGSWRSSKRSSPRPKRTCANCEPQIAAAQTAWEKTLAAAPAVAVDGDEQACKRVTNWTASWRAPSAQNGRQSLKAARTLFAAGRGAAAAAFDGKRFINCGDVGDFGFFDKFTLAAWIQPRGTDGGAILSRMVEQPEDSAFASDSEGYSVHLKDGRLQVHLTKRWLDDALRVETEATLDAGALAPCDRRLRRLAPGVGREDFRQRRAAEDCACCSIS